MISLQPEREHGFIAYLYNAVRTYPVGKIAKKTDGRSAFFVNSALKI